MSNDAERYTIRRKVIKLFGAGFHIYDAQGAVAGYCKQKGFRIREDIRIYTDDSCAEELLVISTDSIWDISGAYMVKLRSGDVIGGFKRHGVKSMMRDQWSVFDHDGRQIGEVLEDSSALATMRRLNDGLAAIFPQRFRLRSSDGRHIATYRTHFNLFVYRLGVTVVEDDDIFDDLLILAGGCILAAIEGRQ